MNPAIAVALIAAVGGLLTSAWTLHRQRDSARELALLQNELAQAARTEERQIAAKEHLDRYREPLLAAADDLRHRIANIRGRSFSVYLQSSDERRRKLALISTMYRLGKYWAVIDGLYRAVNILRFNTESETKRVAGLLDEIGRTFASDAIDGSRLMVWREEQRAIAELMRPKESADGLAVIGFAAFFEDYPTRLAPWFSDLAVEFQLDGVEDTERLKKLHDLLDQLVKQLEAGRPYAV